MIIDGFICHNAASVIYKRPSARSAIMRDGHAEMCVCDTRHLACVRWYHVDRSSIKIDHKDRSSIKKVDKKLNGVYGTIRYGRCSRNPLSGPLLFIYNNIYLYIYIKDFAKQRYNTPYACNVI